MGETNKENKEQESKKDNPVKEAPISSFRGKDKAEDDDKYFIVFPQRLDWNVYETVSFLSGVVLGIVGWVGCLIAAHFLKKPEMKEKSEQGFVIHFAVLVIVLTAWFVWFRNIPAEPTSSSSLL